MGVQSSSLPFSPLIFPCCICALSVYLLDFLRPHCLCSILHLFRLFAERITLPPHRCFLLFPYTKTKKSIPSFSSPFFFAFFCFSVLLLPLLSFPVYSSFTQCLLPTCIPPASIRTSSTPSIHLHPPPSRLVRHPQTH
ncbi:hypothetical protein R3P38DRAFT_2923993, partial [Favolaschia claudopus]